MKKISVMVLLVLFAAAVFPAEMIPLPDVLKPTILKVSGDDMVIAEGVSISIYSLKDKKLVKKFGKAGEGPREFKIMFGLGMEIDIFRDNIVVHSIGKISYFTRKGEFIKEKKITGMGTMTPFQGKFVGRTMSLGRKAEDFKQTFSLYDGKGEKIKDICSHQLPVLQGKGATLLDLLSVSKIASRYRVSPDRVFIGGKQGFEIDVYDINGNALKPVKRKYEKQKIAPGDKAGILNAYKEIPLYKQFWEQIKSGVVIPDYYPEYKTFLVSGKKVYVQTFKKKDGKTEFLVFGFDGKYLKTIFLPLAYQDIVTPFMYTIDNGKLYQLVENEDEEWELKITGIDRD